MNATQLLFSLLADSGVAKNDSTALLASPDRTDGRSTFRQTFTQAMGSRQTTGASIEAAFAPKATVEVKTPRAPEQVERKPAAEADNTASRTQGPAAAHQGQTSRDEARNNADSRDTAPRTESAQREQDVQSDKAPGRAERKAQSAEEAPEDQAGLQETDNPEVFVQELLLDLLALLLAGQSQNEEFQALAEQLGLENLSDLEGLELSFLFDPDSELYKLLSLLMNQEQGMDPELLEELKLMIQLSEDKALQISVADLMAQLEAEEGKTLSLTFESTDGASGEKAALTLMLTPEAVQDAKLVDMANAQSAKGDVSLMVPAELLSDEKLQALLADKQLAAQAQSTDTAETQQDQVIRNLLLQMAEADKSKVLMPLSGMADSAQPQVLTTDPMMLNTSDYYLQQLDLKALADELAAVNKPLEELALRFEMLMGSRDSSQSMGVLMLSGSNGGFDFMDSLMQRFGQNNQNSGESWQWQSEVFAEQVKAEASEARADVQSPVTMDTGAERVPFMGRPAATAETFAQQSVTQTSESRASHNTAQMYEMVMNQIVDRIHVAQMSANGGEMRVFLRPEHLGDLHMKVSVDRDVMVARFVAESHEVKAIIENNFNQLRDALAEAGIKVGRFEVTVSSGFQQGPAPEQGQDAGGQSHAQEQAAPEVEEGGALAANDLELVDDGIYGPRPMSVGAVRCNYLA